MITQTAAIFLAAYRELNARKLFWITMALNVLVVGLYASLGINESGVTLLHWQFNNDVFNTSFVSPELFYKIQFVSWGIPYWLSWIATILALVSTAGMVPDLVTAGAIDTVLSKPIGRWRMFLTKYTAGLLFVGLQVLVFSLGCFLVIWIRGGVLEPSLFLAVPIVLVFFSYLFAVCALIGMVTRSTIAALLLTILFWFAVFLVNVTDELLLGQRIGAEVRLEDARENLDNQNLFADNRLRQIQASGEVLRDADDNEITDETERRYAVNVALRSSEQRVEDLEEGVDNWRKWSSRVTMAKTVLPKTQETVGLLSRYMLSQEDIELLFAEQSGIDPQEAEEAPAFADPRVAERTEKAKRERSVAWVVGTSLAFEAFVLFLCGLLFARRDF